MITNRILASVGSAAYLGFISGTERVLSGNERYDKGINSDGFSRQRYPIDSSTRQFPSRFSDISVNKINLVSAAFAEAFGTHHNSITAKLDASQQGYYYPLEINSENAAIFDIDGQEILLPEERSLPSSGIIYAANSASGGKRLSFNLFTQSQEFRQKAFASHPVVNLLS